MYRWLQEKVPIHQPQAPWPLLLGTSELDGNIQLALQDLNVFGVSSLPFESRLDDEIIEAALKALACLHAQSAIVQESGSSRWEKPPQPWLLHHTTRSFLAFTDYLEQEALARLWTLFGDESDLFHLLPRDSLSKLVESDFAASWKNSHRTAHLLAMGHGDSYINNFLSNGNSLIFMVDFQFAFWGNPLLDLATFLRVSVEPRRLEKRRRDWIQLYRDHLVLHRPDLESRYSLQSCEDDFALADPTAGLFLASSFHVFIEEFTPPTKRLRVGERLVRSMKSALRLE